MTKTVWSSLGPSRASQGGPLRQARALLIFGAMKRQAARIDRNQERIVQALRLVGARVGFWGMDGAPDLVVAYRGRVYLVEVKAPLGPRGGGGGTLTAAQDHFHQRWAGYLHIVHGVEDALALLGILGEGHGLHAVKV